MTPQNCIQGLAVSLSMGAACAAATGAKLVDVRPVDDEHLMIHWLDGEVEYIDNGKGPTAFVGHASGGEVVHRYEPGINTAAAVSPGSYTLSSTDDPAYSQACQPRRRLPQDQGQWHRQEVARTRVHARAHDLPQAPPETAAGQALHAEHRPGHQQRHRLARVHLRHLLQRLRGRSTSTSSATTPITPP